MSGFIFAGAVALWTLAGDVSRRNPRRAAWPAWLVGSLVGSLTMLTWLHYYFQLEHQHSWLQFWLDWFHQPMLHTLFWQLWVTGPLGLGLSGSLGDAGFVDFLGYPLIGGAPIYLMAAAHVAILALAGLAAFRFLAVVWRRPVSLGDILMGTPGSDDQLLLAAGFIGYGVLLTLTVLLIPRHYLMVTFPLEWLWWVLIFQKAFAPAIMRRMLLGLWSCELILSLGCLGYIHVNQGATYGDYGTAYRFQPAHHFQAEFADDEDNQGIALAQKGQLDEAMSHFRAAIRYDSSNAVAHNSLGNIFTLRGQFTEAVPEYEKAVSLNPDYAGAQNNLGFALVQSGRVAEAVPHYQAALRLNPGYESAHYDLGCALAQLGRRDEAVAELKEALRLKPDYAEAKQKLGELNPPTSK
jgi:tetratricopeptide (TPR) repeat protein